MNSIQYRCRECDQTCHRHGKTKGKQRWKCSHCGITQFRIYKRNVFTAERLWKLNREKSTLIVTQPMDVLSAIHLALENHNVKKLKRSSQDTFSSIKLALSWKFNFIKINEGNRAIFTLNNAEV